jgi:hypothetical protein
MIVLENRRREVSNVCDGHRDESLWTLRSRQTGKLIVTTSGHNYLFSDELDAIHFVEENPGADDVEVIPMALPE